MPDFDMGAYGAYVWPAWGISALALAALIVRTATTARRWKTELKRMEGDPARPEGAPGALGQTE